MNWNNIGPLSRLQTLVDTFPWSPRSRGSDFVYAPFYPDMTALAALIERLPNAKRESYEALEMVIPGWYVPDQLSTDRTPHRSEVTVRWTHDLKWEVFQLEPLDRSTF